MQRPMIVEHLAPEAHKQGIQQGVQQGVRESTRRHILEALALRLHPEAAETFKPTLEAIEDEQHLEQLFRAAIRSETPADFTQALEQEKKDG